MHLGRCQEGEEKGSKYYTAVFTISILTYLFWNFVILEIVGIAIGLPGRLCILELNAYESSYEGAS